MKNVQVIDAADNCTYSVYAFTDDEFEMVFHDVGQDVEFIEDFFERLGEENAIQVLKPTWDRLVEKSDVNGIDGTLFYQLRDQKKRYYPTKKEAEMTPFPSDDSSS